MREGYLIIDIGTGNCRVGLATIDGKVHSIYTSDVKYQKDEMFPDAVSFNPQQIFDDIKRLILEVRKASPDIEIKAILSTSQREGIVIFNDNGQALIGLPNVDNRGREWEQQFTHVPNIYQKTGRWPTTVFSALKLVGLRQRQPEIWEKISAFTSISDWIGYELTHELAYEASQASETLLYDVEKNKWSNELCDLFGINMNWLPRVRKSGTILGLIKDEFKYFLNLSENIPFIIGGADTQLAVKGVQPEVDDIVLVSGTTTPIIKIVNDYLIDINARCWVSRNVNENEYIMETNAGVSGLNYQRLKKVFFPNKSYEEIEDEILALKNPKTIASFGTLVFDKNLPLTRGGFYMDAPAHHELTAADFVFGIIFDIASSIKYNFDVLDEVSPISKEYVFGCGGGFKGKVLPQMISDLINKKVIVKEGYSQASVLGGVIICNDTLGEFNEVKDPVKIFEPKGSNNLLNLYEKWLGYRNEINHIYTPENV